MKPRQQVEVVLGDATIAALRDVTDMRLDQGALVVNHDGGAGPEQTIYAPGWWSMVHSAPERDDRG